MRLRYVLMMSAATLMMAACEPKVQAPVDFAHQAGDLKADGAVTYGKLDNGMRYAVMQNATPTKTAAIRLRFDTGSLNDVAGTQGLAHFLEHMAFNGSENIPEGEMTKTLERYGLAFGADTNAYTSFDETVYQLDLPEVTEEMFDVTLKIMRETASNLTLDQDAIDRERGVVQSEKRNRDSPGYRAQIANLEFFLDESRIISNLPIGTDESLAAINKPEFETYYNGHYRPEDAFLVIVGDMEPDFAASKIKEFFSDWTGVGEALPDLKAGSSVKTGLKVGYFTDPDVSTSLEFGVMRPYEKESDTSANRRKGFVEGLGNAMLNRRLQTIVLSGDAPFITASAGSYELYGAAEATSLNMTASPGKWAAALTAGEQELRRALTYGFSQAELDEQIANYRKSLEVSVQTAPTRRTRSLANAITGRFSSERVFTTPQSALERFEATLPGITLDEIEDAFAAQWKGVDEPLIWVTSESAIENPQEKIAGVFRDSQSVAVEKPPAAEKADFAYTDFGAPGEIIFKDEIEDTQITRVKFANNVMLNIKKTDFDKDSVAIKVSFGGGTLSLPADNPHVQQLASYAVTAGGLEAHTNDDLARIMAGKTVGASFGAGTERFSISGTTVPNNLTDQLNLMAAYFVAPGFRPEAEPRYDNYIQGWYPTLDSTPGGVAQRDIARLLRSGDKRFGIPSMDEIIAPTMTDVEAWVKPALLSGQLEIGIVGDVDVQAVIDEVARTFGALPKRDDSTPDYADARKLTFPKGTSAPVTLTHEGEQNRSLLRVYWPAPDGTDIMRDRKLNMLDRVFGLRLLDEVREKAGAAYSPSAFNYNADAFEGYGYQAVSLDLDPKDVGAMLTLTEQLAADFKAGNFTQDEFDRAMKPVLEAIEESSESNGYWMGLVDSAQTDDDYVNHRTRDEAYQSMTIDDLKPLAAQIFDSTKAFKVQILPQE